MNDKTFLDELMEDAIYREAGDPILSESLFGNKRQEISFGGFSKDFKKVVNELSTKISSSLFKNSITLYKSVYPSLYILGENDFRMHSITDVSAGFYLDDISHSTGISINTLANSLIDIVDSLSDMSDYCEVKAVYTGDKVSDEKLSIRIYLNSAYCFPDIMTAKKKKSETISYTLAKASIERSLIQTISTIKSHPLGKLIPLNKDNEQYYSFGNGIIRSISSDFDKRTFQRVYPGLSTFSGCMNLAYILDETIYAGTNLALAPLTRGGIYQLYMSTKPNIHCK